MVYAQIFRLIIKHLKLEIAEHSRFCTANTAACRQTISLATAIQELTGRQSFVSYAGCTVEFNSETLFQLLFPYIQYRSVLIRRVGYRSSSCNRLMTIMLTIGNMPEGLLVMRRNKLVIWLKYLSPVGPKMRLFSCSSYNECNKLPICYCPKHHIVMAESQ